MKVTSLELPALNGRFTVFQGGDLHADLLAFNEKRFKLWQRYVIEHFNRGNASLVVMQGDHVHGRLPGDRFFSSSILRPDVRDRLDDYVNHMVDTVSTYYQPFVDAGIPVILLKGNHDDYLKNVDVTKLIAERTGALYVGAEALVRIRARDQHGKARTRVLYLAHGASGGSMPGSKLNNLVKSNRIADADAYLFGHVHDSVHHVDSIPFVKTDGDAKLAFKERLYSYAASFCTSRVEGVAGYESAKSLPAVNVAINGFVCDTWNDLWLPSRIL